MNKKVKEPVSKIMTKEVITLDLKESLTKACSLFREKKIRHLPVVFKGKMVGVLSFNAISRLSFSEVYDDKTAIDQTLYKLLKIEQIMVAKPIKVSPGDSILKVTKILIKNKFHALPVVEKRKLVGIVSTTDLLKYLISD